MNYLCRHTADDAVVGHVFGDDGSGCNDDVIADSDAGQDGDIAANPDVVSDGDGFMMPRCCRRPEATGDG